MNPAIQAAMVAAQSAETVDTLIARLKKAEAFSPEKAIELDDAKEAIVEEAVAAGVVIRSNAGRYYLDEQAASNRSESNGMIALIALLIMASLAASAIALVAAR